MTQPENNWIDDWHIGKNVKRENQLGENFISIFKDFWLASNLDKKSKTTRSRYSSALHALGGYLTEKGIYDKVDYSASELVDEYITQYEGPLIHHDNEDWQNELDMVCRKLFKFINK